MIVDEVLQFVNNRPLTFPYLDTLNRDYQGNGSSNELEDEEFWSFCDLDIAWLPKAGMRSIYYQTLL